MKKSKKAFLMVLPILVLCLVLVSSYVFAIEVKDPSENGGSASSTVTNLTGNIWSTLAVVIQTLAIAAIVFAGVRYMFASADDKADIKKQTVILVVGAVLVFAAVPIARAIAGAAQQIL